MIEFTISGSVRNAITVSSDAECKIDTAHATAVLGRESEFLEAHATSFMTALRDAIALLDFTAISPEILKRLRENLARVPRQPAFLANLLECPRVK